MVTTANFPEPLDRNFLFLDQVDHAEICRIVHGHFQRGWYPSRDRQVLSNPDNSKFIVIKFDKAYRISTITPAGLTADEEKTQGACCCISWNFFCVEYLP